MNTATIILKAIRAAGLKNSWAALRALRQGPDKDPEYYTFERGHYSVEEDRKASLKVLRLPPDWIFSERDLAKARADLPIVTLTAISFLLHYQYKYESLKQSERELNDVQPR